MTYLRGSKSDGLGQLSLSDKWSQLIDIKRRLLIAWLHPIAPRVIIGWSAVIKEKVLELTPQVDLLLLPKKKKKSFMIGSCATYA